MTDIYRVEVSKHVPNTSNQWVKVFERKTPADTELGAMRRVLEAEAARQMLENQRDIDSESEERPTLRKRGGVED